MDSKADQTLARPAPKGAPKPQRASKSAVSTRIGNLRVGQKLTLIALMFALPIAALLYLLVAAQQGNINFARQELQGSAYLQPLADLQTHVTLHAEAITRARLGDSGAPTEQKAAVQAVEKDFAALAETVRRYPEINVAAELDVMKLNWQALSESVMVLSPEDALRAHTDFVNQQLQPFITLVGNNSKLILDPDIDSYYTMNLLLNDLPGLRWAYERLRLKVAIAARRGTTTLPERYDFAVEAAQIEAAVNAAMSSAQYAVKQNARLQNTLGAAAANLKSSSQGYLQGVRQLANGSAAFSVDPAGLLEIARGASASAITFDDAARAELPRLLQKRIGQFEQQRAVALAAVALVLAVAFVLLVLMVRAITRPLGQLAGAARALGRGNLNVSVPVSGSDEIAVVGASFNDAVTQLREVERKNAEEREAAQRLQGNISEFLDVTMDIAGGDLTKRGRVSEDVLGNVVDSINVMVEELEAVLRSVQDASALVNNGAASMLATTDEIVQGAETTASAAQQVASEVKSVTSSIRGMAENAQASAQTAQLALSASQQGQSAVESTLSGMQNIRREVQGIAKRIKGLGDRSLEIQEIVDTISRISRQTNLLALNAAIEAAGAGEAGSRFAVVADEVRKLADSSAQATGRIATLIKSVQAEIGEVVVSVEDGTREVEAGYRVASTAGERLTEIALFAERSAQLALSISEATRAQVQGVEGVGDAVGSIASVARRAQESVRAGREAAERLRLLSDNLTEQLGRFRLSN